MGVDYQDGEYQVYYGLPDLSGVTGQNKDSENQKAGEKRIFTRVKPWRMRKRFSEQPGGLSGYRTSQSPPSGERPDDQEAYKNLLHYLEDKPSVAGNIMCSPAANLGM
ncbi:MAG: hypothetical protein ACLRMZ_27545 [Blautia marasmi]